MSGSSPLLPHAPRATSQSALPCSGPLHPYSRQFPQLESPTPWVPWAAPRSGPSPSSSEPAAFLRQVSSGRELSSLPCPSSCCSSPFPCPRNPSPRESGGADKATWGDRAQRGSWQSDDSPAFICKIEAASGRRVSGKSFRASSFSGEHFGGACPFKEVGGPRNMTGGPPAAYHLGDC